MTADNPDFLLVSVSYPMFGGSIKRLWGTKEFVTYMKDLIASAQGDSGGNFQSEVLEALHRLAHAHDQEFRQFLPHVEDNQEFKSVMEAFPSIAEKLSMYWGQKEFGPYMTGLLQNNRGDSRKGFPFEILMALHALAEQHNSEYSKLFPSVDLWTQLSG